MQADLITTRIMISLVAVIVGTGLVLSFLKCLGSISNESVADIAKGLSPSLLMRRWALPKPSFKAPPSSLIVETPSSAFLLDFRDEYYRFITKCLEDSPVVAESAVFKTHREDVTDILTMDLFSECRLFKMRSRDRIEAFIKESLEGSALQNKRILRLNFEMTRNPAEIICTLFPNLTVLSMPNAGITGDVEKFSGLGKLEVLQIPDNKLETMPDFSSFPALRQVEITCNPVRIDPGTVRRNMAGHPIRIY